MMATSSRFGLRLRSAAFFAAVAVLAGCVTRPAPIPPRCPIRIAFDDRLAGSSMLVHVVALDAENAQLFGYRNMTLYWQDHVRGEAEDDDRDYPSLRREFHYAGKPGARFEIPASDRLWDTWLAHGAEWVVVMANLPGTFPDRYGAEDARRLFIPITSPKRSPGQSMNIIVQPDDLLLIQDRMQMDPEARR